jgi:hypothetical protein
MKEIPKQNAPAPVNLDTDTPSKNGKTMSPPALFGGSQENKGAESSGNKQAGMDAAAPMLIAQASNPVVDSDWDAWNHYFHGGGKSVEIGDNTMNMVVNNEDFRYRHGRITKGLTSALSGSFSIDMTSQIFHIGRTNVNYRVEVGRELCKVHYELFVNDGFWDPDFIDENTLGRIGIPGFQPDGMGPNLERFGGKPYHYKPATLSFNFYNPGYE